MAKLILNKKTINLGAHTIIKFNLNISKENKLLLIASSVYLIIGAIILNNFNGTGDSGDSVMHYLFAKYAPQHTKLYFDHWAKPVYVLLASPFAQFGFTGVKLFNLIVSTFTIVFTIKIAKELNLKNSWLLFFLIVFAPYSFIITFSGLTEPLFALFISLGTYFSLINKHIVACTIISFLPFVRSEGLIIEGVFGVYYLLNRNFKCLPFLALGHLFYSITGYFVYDDFLWVFKKIPYANLGSPYGSGTLTHFIEQLLYIVGVPIYVLFWIGAIIIMYNTIRNKISKSIFILVFLSCTTFILAHTLFWYFGVFNSMGLKRVLVGIIPLIALISLIGYNFIVEDLCKKTASLKLFMKYGLMLYIVIFIFTPNPAALNFQKELNLDDAQMNTISFVQKLKSSLSSNCVLAYNHPYLSEVLNIDHFRNDQRAKLSVEYKNYLKPGDLIIWENVLSGNEQADIKEVLEKDINLEQILTYNCLVKQKEAMFSVYRVLKP